jgi:hypothetical protein
MRRSEVQGRGERLVRAAIFTASVVIGLVVVAPITGTADGGERSPAPAAAAFDAAADLGG